MARITDGSAAFEVKRVLDGTASTAKVATIIGGEGFTNFSNKTIGELKAFILQKLKDAPVPNKDGLFISFSIAGDIGGIVNNIQTNDSYIIKPGSQISFILTATSTYSKSYFHVKMSSYGYQSYELGVIDGSFEKPRPIVYTLDNGNNTNKITVDRLEGTADKSLELMPYISLGSFAGKTIGELKTKLKEIVRTANTNTHIRVHLVNSAIDSIANNWWNNSYTIPEGHTYSTIIISNTYVTSGGEYAKLFCYTYNNTTYTSVLSSGTWGGMMQVVTKDMEGNIKAKTQATSDSSDNVATTQFVKNAIAAALAEKGV